MEKKPRLTIFKNERAGQQVTKRDGSVVEYNGKPILHSDLNCIIDLPEGLPAGKYDVSAYKYTSQKGLNYYSGNIKPAYNPEKKVDQHNQDKANAYVEEENDQEIPF